jgi:hypothetical protein
MSRNETRCTNRCLPRQINYVPIHQTRKINQIRLSMRDLQILQRHGWRFIYLTGDLAYNFNNTNAKTCVQLSKHAIGIKNIYIQTPNSLYKYLLSD